MNTSYQDFNFLQRPCTCIETDHGPDVINFYTNASSKSSSVIFVKAQAQSLFGDSNVHCLGQKFTAWIKNSLLGSRKSNSLHGSTQIVDIHYLGQIHNLGQNYSIII